MVWVIADSRWPAPRELVPDEQVQRYALTGQQHGPTEERLRNLYDSIGILIVSCGKLVVVCLDPVDNRLKRQMSLV